MPLQIKRCHLVQFRFNATAADSEVHHWFNATADSEVPLHGFNATADSEVPLQVRRHWFNATADSEVPHCFNAIADSGSMPLQFLRCHCIDCITELFVASHLLIQNRCN